MAVPFTTSVLEYSVETLRNMKAQTERAMAQIGDEHLFATIDGETNSIAIIVKHMAGNMRSRWTDFLTADGEKPDRNRDSEFEDAPATREALMKIWEDGWGLVFAEIEPLSDADMGRTVTIRGQAYSVMQAIVWSVTHYANHIGQIILLAKHYAGADWKTLSIAKKRSAQNL